MRVLHVIDGLKAGGAEALLFRLANRPSDVQHEIVSLARPDWYSERITQAGIPLRHLGISSLPSIAYGFVELYRHIRRSRPDVVQGWLYRSNMLSGIAAAAAGVPRVWSIHCASLLPFKHGTRLFVRLTGIAARWLPSVIVNCSAESADVHAALGYSNAECVIVHNGYDPAEFFPDEADRLRIRKDLGIGAGTFLIGSISRWNSFKDIPNLIAAAATASAEGIPLKCILMGTDLDPANDELMRALRAAGCANLFLPLGRRTDVAALVRAIDLHVLSSASEAFPNTVAETMLSGAPNVVTDVGESTLIVGETGWVVPPRDPQELAAAIEAAYREWKNRPDEWQHRQAAARERVAQNFSFEKMANAYHDVWKKVARLQA